MQLSPTGDLVQCLVSFRQVCHSPLSALFSSGNDGLCAGYVSPTQVNFLLPSNLSAGRSESSRCGKFGLVAVVPEHLDQQPAIGFLKLIDGRNQVLLKVAARRDVGRSQEERSGPVGVEAPNRDMPSKVPLLAVPGA